MLLKFNHDGPLHRLSCCTSVWTKHQMIPNVMSQFHQTGNFIWIYSGGTCFAPKACWESGGTDEVHPESLCEGCHCRDQCKDFCLKKLMHHTLAHNVSVIYRIYMDLLYMFHISSGKDICSPTLKSILHFTVLHSWAEEPLEDAHQVTALLWGFGLRWDTFQRWTALVSMQMMIWSPWRLANLHFASCRFSLWGIMCSSTCRVGGSNWSNIDANRSWECWQKWWCLKLPGTHKPYRLWTKLCLHHLDLRNITCNTLHQTLKYVSQIPYIIVTSDAWTYI